MQQFFSMVASFARAFKQACEDLVTRRLEAEKAAKRAAGKAGVVGAGGGSNSRAPPPPPPKGENIFANFQAASASSADAVIDEFKAKLARRKMDN